VLRQRVPTAFPYTTLFRSTIDSCIAGRINSGLAFEGIDFQPRIVGQNTSPCADMLGERPRFNASIGLECRAGFFPMNVRGKRSRSEELTSELQSRENIVCR